MIIFAWKQVKFSVPYNFARRAISWFPYNTCARITCPPKNQHREKNRVSIFRNRSLSSQIRSRKKSPEFYRSKLSTRLNGPKPLIFPGKNRRKISKLAPNLGKFYLNDDEIGVREEELFYWENFPRERRKNWQIGFGLVFAFQNELPR